MFNKFTFLFFIALLIFGSCSKEDDLPDLPVPEEEIFMDFTLDGTPYKISSKEFKLEKGAASRTCDFILGFVTGHEEISLENPEEEGFISSLNFQIKKKVFVTDLNLADSSDYTKQVLNADQYGFPVNQNGFFSVYDLDNEIFEVPQNVSAEAYLWIVTHNEGLYRSTSVVHNERDPDSNLIINKVIKVDHALYQYIIEGSFRVNLFEGMYGTTSKIAEGSFRWPVVEIPFSELTDLCN